MKIEETTKLEQSSTRILADLKPLYKKKCQEVYAFHKQGGTGTQVVKALSDLADQMLLKAFQSIDPRFEQEWGGTLIAIGGYGRQELSPGSDIDLMFLYPDNRENESETAISELLCLLWDLGYKVGHSARTVGETIALAREDPLIATSLLESRFLHGDRTLFKRFHEHFFSKVIDRNIKDFLRHLEAEREGHREKYGDTAYLLEPNLKQSPGGLRDIHTLRWFASARHRTHHLPQIHQWGHLSSTEYTRLVQAQEFLWRIRNHLHFLAEKPSDHLTMELQEEIAPFFQFNDRRGLMRRYYIETGGVLEISRHFTRETIPLSRTETWIRPWKTRQVAPGFQIYSGELSINAEKPFHFLEDDENTIRIFLLAKKYSVRIEDSILEILHDISEKRRDRLLSPKAISLFKTLISVPGGIADTLRLMHRVHLLWRIIPEFEDVHYLVQQSRSHAFTVDEHSFVAVEEAERLMNDKGLLHDLYEKIHRKDLLHLAILLHDIGKGGVGKHSKVGATIAESVCRRMGYLEKDCAFVVFLVREHLVFSEVALFRDFSNEPILFQFVKKVDSIEKLQCLLILTCADIRGTAPGLWTDWKGELLLKLYRESSRLLSGETAHPDKETISALKDRIWRDIQDEYPEIWIKKTLSSLTSRYLLGTSFEKILIDLEVLFRLKKKSIQLGARHLPEQGITEITLYTYDWITTGLFSKMTGVLAAKGLQILAVHVFTHQNGMVIDTFEIMNRTNEKNFDPDLFSQIKKEIRSVITGKESVENLFSRGRVYAQKKNPVCLIKKVRIELDNESSNKFTVMEVYSADTRGLLYKITKILVELGLDVHAAKIATRLDQVVDIFYLLGPDQQKITDAPLIARIKAALTQGIEAEFPK